MNLLLKQQLRFEKDKQTENTLGTLQIKSEDLSDSDELKLSKETQSENIKLKPDEEFQIAFDLLRSQKFEQAKTALQKFILNHKDSELSGSAHYWLGEIHLLKKDYREAALIFAEGYQKHPQSVKSPDILYKLASALEKIDKINESCNTLLKFKKDHSNHKLIKEINFKINELNCV